MKIVHTADLHIGLETHGPMNPHTGLARRLEDFLASLDAIVDAAIEENADLVVMAGDIYKGRDPNATHQRLFARRVFRLVQHHIPVFLLAGNHDLPNAVSRATSIDIFHELDVTGVSVARAPGLSRINTQSGPLLMAALPWVTRASLLAHEEFRALGAQDLERQMVNQIVRSAEYDAAFLGCRGLPALPEMIQPTGDRSGKGDHMYKKRTQVSVPRRRRAVR